MSVPASTRDRGSTTIAMTLAVAIVMVISVQVANVMVFHYGRAAVRAALDDGARVGARATPGGEVAACEATARATVDALAPGLGGGVTIRCDDAGESVIAEAYVHFQGWLSSVADHESTMTASAAKANR